MERLDKVFSNLGLMSRSECRQAVKQKLISVNGNCPASSDIKVDPDCDVITWRGEIIDTASHVYYMLHKPEGVITATKDDNAPTVMGLIDDCRTDLAAVGRLDKDTTGLLLITNDGQLNHRLLSPARHVTKRYEALIEGLPADEDIRKLREGMDIGDDDLTLPAEYELLEEDIACDGKRCSRAALTITEGRYHQVKRMLAKINCPVLRLHRSDFGPLHLDEDLKPGQYRKLSDEELELLKNI